MSRPIGPSRVRGAFASAAEEGRAALVAYVMAGFPDESSALAAAEAALEGGADLLEVGVPFSDPLADGPVIAAAGRDALHAGGGWASALRLVAELRRRGRTAPILAMSYLNPLVAAGERAALAATAEAGADGLIIPDLPAGEERHLERFAAEAGLALCFLVAPNTDGPRLEAAIAASSGFLYVVPLFGVTGVREGVAHGAVELLRRCRASAHGRVPVAAGFGIASPEQVRSLAPLADGIVVGSALVAALRDGGPADGPRRLGDLVGELRAATLHAGAVHA